MKIITGHMRNLYNLVADNREEICTLFSEILNVPVTEIRVTLRRTDISAQVIINDTELKQQCGTKIVFIVNRLDEYETYPCVTKTLHQLQNTITIKERGKKIAKIKATL
jgi:hypothetical protein